MAKKRLQSPQPSRRQERLSKPDTSLEFPWGGARRSCPSQSAGAVRQLGYKEFSATTQYRRVSVRRSGPVARTPWCPALIPVAIGSQSAEAARSLGYQLATLTEDWLGVSVRRSGPVARIQFWILCALRCVHGVSVRRSGPVARILAPRFAITVGLQKVSVRRSGPVARILSRT